MCRLIQKASSPALLSNQKTPTASKPSRDTVGPTQMAGRKKAMCQKYSEIESLASGIITPSGEFRSQQAALHYTRHFIRLLDRMIKSQESPSELEEPRVRKPLH